MAQIITMSANTAAIAGEAIKERRRLSAKQTAEEAAKLLERAGQDRLMTEELPQGETVLSLSANLSLLNSWPNKNQATVREAMDAYRETGA